jgi:hypothetical protein
MATARVARDSVIAAVTRVTDSKLLLILAAKVFNLPDFVNID